MTAKEVQIIKTFAKVLPNLTGPAKEYLLGVGEGMAIATGMSKPGDNLPEPCENEKVS